MNDMYLGMHVPNIARCILIHLDLMFPCPPLIMMREVARWGSTLRDSGYPTGVGSAGDQPGLT